MRNRRHRSLPKSSHTFSSRLEEMKTYEYLNNLINSRFLSQRTAALFNMSASLLGKELTLSLLKETCPEVSKDKELQEWADCQRLDERLPPWILIRFLKEGVGATLSRRKKEIGTFEPDLKRRINYIQNLFGLTDEEVEILIFCFLRESCPVLDDNLDNKDAVGSFSSLPFFRGHGHAPIGIEKSRFIKAISEGNLIKAHLIDLGCSSRVTISDWPTEYISGVSKENKFFTKENDTALNTSDFSLAEEDLTVLNTLMKSRDGHNILFYGAPGAGKTSFAKSLAKEYGKELLIVKIPESDEHKDRLQAIYATINIADRKKTIVLVDEADEVLNSADSIFFKGKTNKSWINNVLESHKKKIIWITNRSDQIDRSTMRRFSFSIEFRKLDSQKRLKVLGHELEKKGMEKFFSDVELQDLCKTYSVDAGGIVNAIKAAGVSKRTGKDAAMRRIKTVLRSHEKATGVKSIEKNEKKFSDYSLNGLNTSLPPEDIISAVRQYVMLREKEPVKYNLPFTILLYGPPGTGKSEFVYYLGNLLKKEVLLKRCSEIQSMWVGQTEKNIAGAFSDARETDRLLFFDEADSFLYPRKDANHSWEKNFTNEILTQMESFRGVVVFATNDIEGLDHASLRRFRFKIEFMPLTCEGVLSFYETMLQPLVSGSNAITEEQKEKVGAIKNLTPGDFAVVKSQCLFMEHGSIHHEMLIKSLMNEAGYRGNPNKKIGFYF